MQKKSILFPVFLLLFLLDYTHAQTSPNFWTKLPTHSFELLGSYRGIPTHYNPVTLDDAGIRSFLQSLPKERDHLPGKPLLIPFPDGSFQRFELVAYSMMEPALAQKYPEIKTFLGKGLDDPYANIRISMTPEGFSGIIHHLDGTIYIDPYPAVNQQLYFVYDKKAYRAARTFAEGSLPQDQVPGGGIPLMPLNSGQELRTYRIAIATTGEYSAFHGNTKSQVMAAIITTLNRVNSIYEREVAVRLILVNNNDRIIYLNPNNDPFTNNNSVLLIDESQATIDAEIGTANYDIGHVFSTGAGGLALTGVCIEGIKANGVTGTSSPIGDPFDVDFVAHEIGHQFGALHTFNSVRGACQGNRVASVAYEPGSGSTIMAYAGLCGSDNLQLNSNDYFHHISYAEIVNYITLDSGNTCGTLTPTGNTPPEVSTTVGNMVIPLNTPFELVGSATDADGDSLSYCWEQYDTGPAGSPRNPSGNAPIFRSFAPTASPFRIFPRIEDLVENTATLGETLPTYGRPLNFRLTVRDHNPNGGGVDFVPAFFTVSQFAGPFKVTFPNTFSTIWIRNPELRVPIQWDPANTTLAPISLDSVSIHLSLDGGYTYPYLLERSVPNLGMASVKLPLLNSDSARIKVKALGNVFFDISDENFSIKLDLVGLDPLANSLHVQISPNPVADFLFIQMGENFQAESLIEIFDLQGKSLLSQGAVTMVQKEGFTEMDLRKLSRGLYVLRLRSKNQFHTQKIIKQ